MLKELHSNEEALQAAKDELLSASESKKWMIVVWEVKDGKLRMHRITFDFPTGDFLIAIGQLANGLSDTLKTIDQGIERLPNTPLPKAPIIKEEGVCGRVFPMKPKSSVDSRYGSTVEGVDRTEDELCEPPENTSHAQEIPKD